MKESIFKFKSPYTIALALGVANYIWYVVLNKIYISIGYPKKEAALYSFTAWILTLPFTFWLVYFWACKRLKLKVKEEQKM